MEVVTSCCQVRQQVARCGQQVGRGPLARAQQLRDAVALAVGARVVVVDVDDVVGELTQPRRRSQLVGEEVLAERRHLSEALPALFASEVAFCVAFIFVVVVGLRLLEAV